MNKNRRTDGRLRVSGGYAGLALLTIAALMIVAPYLHADDPPPPPKMLLAANTADDAWSFDLIVSAGDAPLKHDFSQCGVTSAAEVDLPAHGATVLRDPVVCVHGFALLPAPAAPAVAESVVTFGDGVSMASFTLPPIGALWNDDPAVLDRVMVSDGREGIWLTLLPEHETPFYVVLRNAEDVGADPVIEKFRASPPIGQYRVEAQGVFRVEVYLGTDPLYRCFPAQSCAGVFGNVYGFGSNGTPLGGSMRVSVFGE